MAHDYDDDDNPRQSLLEDKTCPLPNLNEKSALQRRRFLRCRSAPVSENLCPEQNDIESLQHFGSAFAQQEIGMKQVFLFLVAYLGVGTLCFFLVRNQIKGVKTNGILDAIYFCVVTMTTVGYGDLVPHTTLAKVLACIYVFTGMALGGHILGKAADYLVEKQQILMVKAMHLHEKVNPAEILKEVETHKVKYKFLMATVILVVLMIAGTIFLSNIENLKFIDAFYCVCSTVTTLGYGDKSFSTTAGRVFAVFWILSSTICLAQFFLYLTELYTEKRQRSLIKWVLTRQLTFSDLEAADLDHDKAISAAEFIIYKLKELGKIRKEDISPLMERFQKLDVDHSGALTAADILLSRAS
ncbi:hypothetical protein Dsin_012767 [Dipteronia sinensis]|uniref:Potassium channel domain-containing protein n=1 Tax=Dipteronia sinensis TaxID=43782 RepID=A0AAE0E8S3_9ROSI|nr:hypothetical protein Dsin_012767 [Dipteronia sinensis]